MPEGQELYSENDELRVFNAFLRPPRGLAGHELQLIQFLKANLDRFRRADELSIGDRDYNDRLLSELETREQIALEYIRASINPDYDRKRTMDPYEDMTERAADSWILGMIYPGRDKSILWREAIEQGLLKAEAYLQTHPPTENH